MRALLQALVFVVPKRPRWRLRRPVVLLLAVLMGGFSLPGVSASEPSDQADDNLVIPPLNELVFIMIRLTAEARATLDQVLLEPGGTLGYACAFIDANDQGAPSDLVCEAFRDGDQDLVPNQLEPVLCMVVETVNAPLVRCTTGDIDAGAWDVDQDWVPDAFEPTLCQASDTVGEDLVGRCNDKEAYNGTKESGYLDATPLLCDPDSRAPADIAARLWADPDCDGYTTLRELDAGCDPLDPESYPNSETCA